jgi:hypothetical protein
MYTTKFLIACLFLIVSNSYAFGVDRCGESFGSAHRTKIKLNIDIVSLQRTKNQKLVLQDNIDPLETVYRYQLAQNFSQGITKLLQEPDWNRISENARAQRIAELQFELEFNLAIKLKDIQSTKMRAYQKALAKLNPADVEFKSKGFSILSAVKPSDILSSNAELWIDLSKRLAPRGGNHSIEVEFDPWLHNY